MTMLLPQELRNYTFGRVLRGYSVEDVDEYIDFLVAKYSEVYGEYQALEGKLAAAARTLQAMKEREAKIAALEKEMKRAAAKLLADAEAARGKILAGAEDRRRTIIAEADAYAARVTAEADARAAVQEARVEQIKGEVEALQNTLFAAYSSHIDRIEALTALVSAVPSAEMSGEAAPLEEVAEEIVPDMAAGIPDAIDEIEEIEEIEEIDEIAEAEETDPIAEDEYTVAELTDEDLFGADDGDVSEEIAAPADEDEYTAEELADTDAFADFEELEALEELEEFEESTTADAEDGIDDDALLRSLQEAFGLQTETVPAEAEDTFAEDEVPDEEAVAQWESFEEFSDFDKFSASAKKDSVEEYEEIGPYTEVEAYEEYEEVVPTENGGADPFAFLAEDK